MIYNKNGLKCELPDKVKIKNDFPYLSLDYYKKKYASFSAFLETTMSFEQLQSIHTDPSGIPAQIDGRLSNEIIRHGISIITLNAEELMCKTIFCSGSTEFYWATLIPLGGNVILLRATADTLEMMSDVWTPIVASMEFDEEIISRLDLSFQLVRKNWKARSEDKSFHYKHLFSVNFAAIWFYDSNVEDGIDPFFSDEEHSQGMYKRGKAVKFFADNNADVRVDFYLNNKKEMKEDAWDHIVESVIDVSSGKLCISADQDPEIEIRLKPGHYKFRIYKKYLLNRDPNEQFAVCFFETDEKESNQVTVIKQLVA